MLCYPAQAIAGHGHVRADGADHSRIRAGRHGDRDRIEIFELVKRRCADFIRSYALPRGLLDKVGRSYDNLARKDLELVDRGLRQFFLAHLLSGRRFVAMPSQIADDLWHEFILYTRAYDEFCRNSFGRFLHHTPAVVLEPANRESNTGLRRVWYWACKDENIDPRNATRLPLLFALDAKFKIPNGYFYTPDCKRTNPASGDAAAAGYCGGDFSSSSVDGSTDGFGDSSGGSDGGGDGGGCGGGGGD